jgi:hypothetical protein
VARLRRQYRQRTGGAGGAVTGSDQRANSGGGGGAAGSPYGTGGAGGLRCHGGGRWRWRLDHLRWRRCDRHDVERRRRRHWRCRCGDGIHGDECRRLEPAEVRDHRKHRRHHPGRRYGRLRPRLRLADDPFRGLSGGGSAGSATTSAKSGSGAGTGGAQGTSGIPGRWAALVPGLQLRRPWQALRPTFGGGSGGATSFVAGPATSGAGGQAWRQSRGSAEK